MCKSGTSRGHTRPYRNNLGRMEVRACMCPTAPSVHYPRRPHSHLVAWGMSCTIARLPGVNA
jgi:hypothetical protein